MKLSPVSPQEAVALIQPGHRVYIHGASAVPLPLVEAMCAEERLRDVALYHLHLNGPAPFAAPGLEERFRSQSLFAGENVREAIAEGRADAIPIFLSDIPWLFNSRKVDLDVALIQLSPPDRHGWCSLGPSVDASRAAADSARIVIAEINRQMPRTHGDSFVHISRVDRCIETDRPLLERPPAPMGEIERSIGRIVASFIKDGDTLQLGIGTIADATASCLHGRSDLGIHTEMFSDPVVDLVNSGVITNARKELHAGHMVTSFVSGSKKVFDLVDDNPMIEFHPCDYTNDTSIIRKHANMVAVNGAIEIDLTGQVCADSMGHRIFSGIGGQMDFIRGAALARNGRPIIALPSTARKGQVSRITHALNPGAGVVTTRGHVHWVVTEYGAVNLHGLSFRQRAEALISIAHPDFREDLRQQAASRRVVPIG
jgi:acyl-CoA hydrolase